MAEQGPAAPRFAYKADRLKPLRAFCQTARLGSVSRAAEALYVSQPAVTLQLQALERELGIKLFERSGRRLVPSREGQILYELAKPLVEGLDGLDTAFREQVRGLVDAVIENYGGIDILVNNAGMTSVGLPDQPAVEVVEMTDAGWDLDIGRNLHTAFNVTRAVLPAMVGRG